MTDTHKDPNIADLVGGITKDVQTLVRGEIELAKSEVSVSAKRIGVGAGLFAGAAFLLLFATLLLAFALAYALVAILDWPIWTGFAMVGGFLLLIALVLVLVGVRKVKKVRGLQQTIEEVDKTKAAIADRQGLGVATGLVGPETLGLEEPVPAPAESRGAGV
jgi:uncharacterized membrane protein YqjE